MTTHLSAEPCPDFQPTTPDPCAKEQFIVSGSSNNHSAILTVDKEQIVFSAFSPDLLLTAKVVLHHFFNVCGGPPSLSQESNMDWKPPGHRGRRKNFRLEVSFLAQPFLLTFPGIF